METGKLAIAACSQTQEYFVLLSWNRKHHNILQTWLKKVMDSLSRERKACYIAIHWKLSYYINCMDWTKVCMDWNWTACFELKASAGMTDWRQNTFKHCQSVPHQKSTVQFGVSWWPMVSLPYISTGLTACHFRYMPGTMVQCCTSFQ